MVKADRWIGILFALFSFYVCVESVRFGLGTYQQPGAGFVSFCAGMIVGVLSLALVFLAFSRGTKIRKTWHNPGRVVMVFLAILAFTLLLEWLGFILAAFLLIWFLLKFVEQRGWGFSLGVALVVAGASHVVFDLWLRAQLPAGILGN